MTNALIQRAVALSAAAATTLILFSAVVSIAREDQMALAAAQAGATKVVAVGSPGIVR